jgi:hypothetical protein
MKVVLVGLAVGILIAVLTIIIGTNKDEKYGSSTKGNLIRLSAFYVILIVGAIIGLTVYIMNIN